MTRFSVQPIGVVRASRAAAIDDDWDAVESRIELDPDVLGDDAALGLDAFSHVEIVYLFHLVDEGGVCTGARHRRGRRDWPLTGILAQRAKDRPATGERSLAPVGAEAPEVALRIAHGEAAAAVVLVAQRAHERGTGSSGPLAEG